MRCAVFFLASRVDQPVYHSRKQPADLGFFQERGMTPRRIHHTCIMSLPAREGSYAPSSEFGCMQSNGQPLSACATRIHPRVSFAGSAKGKSTCNAGSPGHHRSSERRDSDVIDRDSSANRSDVTKHPGKPLTGSDPARPPGLTQRDPLWLILARDSRCSGITATRDRSKHRQGRSRRTIPQARRFSTVSVTNAHSSAPDQNKI
jgi:hypothetical protein